MKNVEVGHHDAVHDEEDLRAQEKAPSATLTHSQISTLSVVDTEIASSAPQGVKGVNGARALDVRPCDKACLMARSRVGMESRAASAELGDCGNRNRDANAARVCLLGRYPNDRSALARCQSRREAQCVALPAEARTQQSAQIQYRLPGNGVFFRRRVVTRQSHALHVVTHPAINEAAKLI